MKSQRFPWLPALLVAAGLLLIAAAGYGLWVTGRQVPDPPLPAELAGLALKRQTGGPEAVRALNQMHGKEFRLVSGAIGEYGSAGQATLWVSGAGSQAAAGEMLAAMAAKIALGRSPFTPLGERQVKGRMIYELDGLGQRHFYFQSGDRLVWLAVDFRLAEAALEEMLTTYP